MPPRVRYIFLKLPAGNKYAKLVFIEKDDQGGVISNIHSRSRIEPESVKDHAYEYMKNSIEDCGCLHN